MEPAPRSSTAKTASVLLLASSLALVAPAPAVAHGDLHDQIAAATERISREPGIAELYLRRGELHRAHRDWAAALADYDRASELDSGLAGLDLARGRALFEAGQAEQARRALDQFLAGHPEDVAALLTRARTLAALGRVDAAVADYSRAIEASARPRPELYIERALVLAERPARLGEALGGLDDGLRRLGPVITLEALALEFELRAGRHDAALARVDRLAAGAARQEAWLARRGEILELAGHHAEARRAFRAALEAAERLPEARRRTRAVEEILTRARLALDRLGGLEDPR
jgi:tetratricopeptide (TPR) repeat protein